MARRLETTMQTRMNHSGDAVSFSPAAWDMSYVYPEEREPAPTYLHTILTPLSYLEMFPWTQLEDENMSAIKS